MDMAVGIIVGGAFTAIVKSMVSVILNPILGIFLGGVDFSSLSVSVGDAVFSCGNFIMAVKFNAGRVCVGHAGAAGKSDQTGDAKTSGKNARS